MNRLLFAAILVLAAVFFSSPAHAQLVIQIRDGSGGILGTFPSGVVVLKAGTDFAFSVSGSTVTLTPTGTSGTAFNVTVNGAALADAVAMQLSDTTPAAGSGRTNVLWSKDASSPTNVSASIPNCAEGMTHSPGIVPDPGATPGTTRYLREDCSWQTIPSVFYQTVQSAGSSQTQRAKLNFLSSLIVADNPGNGSTDVSVPATPVCANGGGHTAGLVPDPTSGGSSSSYLGADCAFHVLPAGGIDLQTNGVSNTDQTTLNLIAGSNMTLTPDGSGGVTLDATSGGGGGTAFQSLQRQTTMIADGATTTLQMLGDNNSSCTFTAGTIVAQAPTSANGAAVEYPPSGGPGQGVLHCGLLYLAGRHLKFNVKGYLTTTGDNFGYLGLYSQFGNYLTGTRSSTPAASSGINYEGFSIQNKSGSSVSTHWLACTGDGSLDSCTDTGVTQDTASHTWTIVETPGTNVLFYIDGTLVATNTTHLPTANTAMSFVESQYYTSAAYNFGLTQILIASDL